MSAFESSADALSSAAKAVDSRARWINDEQAIVNYGELMALRAAILAYEAIAADRAKRELGMDRDHLTTEEEGDAYAQGWFDREDFAEKECAALPVQQAQCRTDGRCKYAIDHGAEGIGACPPGKCVMPVQQARVPDDPTDKFIADVAAELKRARAKFPGDRIMTIALAEEFGELAKAMLDESGANVWKEAVQTAVMAARVAIDGDSSVDEWRAAKGLDNHRCAAAPTPPREPTP